MAPNITDCVLKSALITSEPLIVKEPLSSQKQTVESDVNNNNKPIEKSTKKNRYFEQDLVWRNIIIIGYSYYCLVYGFYLLRYTKWISFIWLWGSGFASAFGITAGAHRLWAHKAYKAKLPLRIFLMILQTMAFQNCIHEWARDHRVHHKYTDTNADPHNSKRGFVFSHVGWLMMKKHPDVKEKGKTIDMSDLEADPVVMWQKRNFGWFMPIVSFFGPMALMYFVFGETFHITWHTTITRWALAVNITWLLNSAAHMWGWRPYDKNISPTNTMILGFICFGEGWHNYHHVFPWDYKTSELVNYTVNFTNGFIDFFAKIGQAYDLKTVSYDMIRKRVLRTGDGSHPISKEMEKKEMQAKLIEFVNKYHEESKDLVWGWDDKDMDPEEKRSVKIYNKTDDKTD